MHRIVTMLLGDEKRIGIFKPQEDNPSVWGWIEWCPSMTIAHHRLSEMMREQSRAASVPTFRGRQ